MSFSANWSCKLGKILTREWMWGLVDCLDTVPGVWYVLINGSWTESTTEVIKN